MVQGGPDKGPEERVRISGAGLEFGMKLTAHEPGMIGQFDHLHQLPIGRNPADHQTMGFQEVPVLVVHLVSMSVPV